MTPYSLLPVQAEALQSTTAQHGWSRPAEAQQSYSVWGSDSTLIRLAAKWFGKSSANAKLWTTAAIPLVVAIMMAVPAYLSSVALQDAVAAGGASDLSTVLHYAALLQNVAIGAVVMGALLSWIVAAVLHREVICIVTDIISAQYDLLDGQVDKPMPFLGRADEYGQIARGLEALREKMKLVKKLEEERWSNAQARDAERMQLVTAFERSLGDVISGVASAASQLHSTAGILAAGTEQAQEQTDIVTRAIEDTASSTTAAATASDEFAMSIGEISRQASSSADLARRAREAATSADDKISHLSTAAGEIGEIVGLIRSIAQRTNLLALNASIEAARGGEAGRGFAVVASEVKDLAAQTSRATDQVAQQIADIQASTGHSVQALQAIGQQVKELELTAVSIASAVDQQSVAGQELARSLDMAARGTEEVSSNIVQVRDATRNTGIAATQVLQSADELERQAGMLRSNSLDLARQFRSAKG